jgi:hypothetical protein
MTRATEITLVTGERYVVEGDAKHVERAILDAARGSIMELAWMIESETGQSIAVNPEYVVMLRATGPEARLQS